MGVGGNTTIIVDNYFHSESNDNLGLREEVKPNTQQGINIYGDNTDLNLIGNLDITMLNGNRSMGILAYDNANLNVGGNTTITVKNAPYYAYGISNVENNQNYSLNSPDKTANLHFQGDLTIETEGGNNSIGINLKESNNNYNAKAITVDGHLDITAKGATAYNYKTDLQTFPNSVSNYGVYLYQVTGSTFNTADIKTISKGEDVESIGSYVYWHSDSVFNGDVKYTTQADDNAVAISALARAGSDIDYKRGLVADGKIVLNAVGNTWGEGSKIKVNSSENVDSIVQLNGNIVVGKTDAAMVRGETYDTVVDTDTTKNIITANLLNANSHFTGTNEYGNEGGYDKSQSEIDLTFKNGAKWNMTDSTNVTDLVLADSAALNMNYNAGDTFRTLNAKTMNGEGGIVNMNIDASKNTASDRLYIEDTHNGIHYITLNNVGADTEGAKGTVLVSVGTENGEFKANDSEGALYWNRYDLVQQDSLEEGYTKDWVLNEIELVDDKTTTAVGAIMGANALNYYTWRAENDQLMRRMGELRNNGEDEQGAWFRVHGNKISRDDNVAFENQYTSYEFGYDQVTKQTEDITRYTGAALSYTDGDSSYECGSGENHSKAIAFYNTDIYKSGHYLDLVFKYANMDNDFNVYDTNNNKISGEYKNTGISVSAEYGRKNDMQNGWYIEPQAQLTLGYFGGDEYETSNGIKVEQGGITSVLGRVGFNIGKELGDSGVIYAKANLLHEFGGDYDIDMTDSRGISRSERESFNDTWFEYGIGTALKTGKNNHLYFDFVKTAGGDFEKDWQWNAGMRWTF